MRLLSFLDVEKEEDCQRQETREMRLHEAAMKGSVTSLLELLHEDPLILTKEETVSPISDAPLHVAALLGRSEFARELLSQNPQLAAQFNAHGSSPLHFAAAKGYVEIVKQLMLVNPDICFVQDHDGRTPLHLAAIKGRATVLTELIRFKPEGVRVLTKGGESGLHLSVKYNRLEALKVLVEGMERDEFVNWKDQDGNTVLHIAVAKKQIEIIKFLLVSTAIQVHAQNTNGFTASDVLSHGPRDLRDMEIKECLCRAGASRNMDTQSAVYARDLAKKVRIMGTQSATYARDLANDVTPITQPPATEGSRSKQEVPKHKHTDWLGRKRSALMVVASLLATVAFQAAISPPGGLWQDDLLVDSAGNPVEKPHKVGLSVMAYNLPSAYGLFMICNTIAFLSSLSIIMLLVSGLPMRRRRWMWSQMVIMWLAICAQTSTYIITLINMTPDHVQGVLYEVAKVSGLTWFALMGLVFIGNITRMCLYLLRKYGYIKEKQRARPNYVNDDNDDL